MAIEIITNGHSRDLLHYWELTDKEREWFDFDGAEDAEYFYYRGECYCMADFVWVDHPFWSVGRPKEFDGWDGYHSEGFCGGLLVKYPRDDWGEDTERVIVGVYY